MSQVSPAAATVERRSSQRRSGERRAAAFEAPEPPAGRSGFALAAELAHDLRSPVSAIHMLAHGLESGAAGPVQPLQRRQLGLIRSAAYSLCAVATDLEVLARGSRTLLDGEPAPFSIRDVFRGVRSLVAPLQEAKGVALRFSLPAATPDRRVGFTRALTRILLNLTTNALQATDCGAVDVTARVRDRRCVEFSVSDTGGGVDTRSLAAGLGLTICRDLLGALGSTLEMSSQAGVGTSVRFALDLPPVGFTTAAAADRRRGA